MKWIFCAAFLCYHMFGTAQPANEYQETRITGTITPNGVLQYARSAKVGFRSTKLSPSIGELTVEVPIENNRFSMWVPPLPVGERIYVSLQYNATADSLPPKWDRFPILVADTLVDISIKGRMSDALLIQGEQNKARIAYMSVLEAPRRAADTLRNKLYRKKIDTAAYEVEMQKLRQLRHDINKKFILNHPRSVQSLLVLEDMVKQYLNNQGWAKNNEAGSEEYRKLNAALHPSLQKKERAQNMLASLQMSEERSVIPFTGVMPDGKVFDVASLKGKVFLIDFWGSWCYWCRKGHPHLKELYRKYKSRGFEIIGVGYEVGAGEKHWDKFRQAIKEDDLPWLQILNDPSRQDIVSQYMVTSFPTKLLVNREGRIILQVDSDEERLLDAKLKEIFGE